MGNTPATHAPKGGCTAGTKKATEEMLLSASSSAAIRRYIILLNIRYFTPPHGQKTARLRPLSAANASTVQFRKRSNIVQYIIFTTFTLHIHPKAPHHLQISKHTRFCGRRQKYKIYFHPPLFFRDKNSDIFLNFSYGREQATGDRKPVVKVKLDCSAPEEEERTGMTCLPRKRPPT